VLGSRQIGTIANRPFLGGDEIPSGIFEPEGIEEDGIAYFGKPDIFAGNGLLEG
jgi:hypothetical protein